jgi:small-conductance mechanosensitive channel
MERRRIVFSFGIIYNTPVEKVEKISGMVKQIIDSQTRTQFDRAHFLKFGDSSLDFEVVYNVLDPDYTIYMDRQQAINLALMQKFEVEGIEFAYPTRTLILSKETASGTVMGGVAGFAGS